MPRPSVILLMTKIFFCSWEGDERRYAAYSMARRSAECEALASGAGYQM
jgi:hypothetical protein